MLIVQDIKEIKSVNKLHFVKNVWSLKQLVPIGIIKIQSQLDNVYRKYVRDYNENVSKNLYMC